MPHRTLAPLALLGMAACGPLLSAEVVVDRFCFTQHACSAVTTCLPPIPPGGTAGFPLTFVVPVPLSQNLPPLLRDKGSDVVVRLLDARVTPTAGATDLGGIQTLDLRVLPPAGPAVPVAHYSRPVGATSVPAIDPAGQGVDVIGYLQSGSLQMQVAITADGPPPDAPWNADLQVCFYGKTVVSYL